MADNNRSEIPTQNEFARSIDAGGGFEQLFSIRDYVSSIVGHWRIFIVAALIGVIWGVNYESSAPKKYTVSVYVGPVGDAPVQSGGGVGGLVSMFISGGSMAVGPPEWSRYVFALKSVRLAEKIEREHHLIKKLFSSRWDAKTHTWKPTPGFMAGIQRKMREMFGLPGDPAPDVTSLQGYITGNVQLYTDKTTGLTTISMISPDPKAALDLILLVHRSAVDLVREEIAKSNQAKMNYLTRTLAKTANADQRGVLIGMLAQTEQTQMLLNNHLPFAAQIIDTPVVPSQPSSPQTLDVVLMYRIGLMIFFVLGMLALDQIAGTNFVEYTETKLRRFPRFVMTRVSRYREFGWQGVFSRSS